MEIPVHSMTIAEKLDAMEQLWSSMQFTPERSTPDWHAELLADRQKRIDNGEVSFSTLDEVKARLDRNRG